MTRSHQNGKPPNLVQIKAPNYGEVGAGTVVPFAPRRESVTVLVPRALAGDDEIGTITVNGESLSDHGIQSGDILLFRTNGTNRDVTPETVCVVRIVSTGEMLAKKIVRRTKGTGMLALRSSGGGIPDRFIHEDDIEVLGIVFGFQRMADKNGRFPLATGEDVPL